MATNFPTSLDTLTNPTPTSSMSGALSHAGQHSDVNDAVEALQAKVGADSSAVTSSHDYLIGDHASRLTTLEAQGEWVDYASTQTFSAGLTVGNGTLVSRYARIGDVVHMSGYFILGSTSAISGNVDMSIPYTNLMTTIQDWPGHARFWDQSSNLFWGGTPVAIGTGTFRLTYFLVSGSLVRNGDLGQYVPITWTSGDGIFWSFSYGAVA